MGENKGIPYYPVSLNLVDEKQYNIVPSRIDDGMYYLKAPKDIHLGSGASREIDMNIIVAIPGRYMLMSKDDKELCITTIHAFLDSIYDVLVDKGVEILAPRVLTPAFGPIRLKLFIRNISPKNIVVKEGDPIASICFAATPPVILGATQQTKGN